MTQEVLKPGGAGQSGQPEEERPGGTTEAGGIRRLIGKPEQRYIITLPTILFPNLYNLSYEPTPTIAPDSGSATPEPAPTPTVTPPEEPLNLGEDEQGAGIPIISPEQPEETGEARLDRLFDQVDHRNSPRGDRELAEPEVYITDPFFPAREFLYPPVTGLIVPSGEVVFEFDLDLKNRLPIEPEGDEAGESVKPTPTIVPIPTPVPALTPTETPEPTEPTPTSTETPGK